MIDRRIPPCYDCGAWDDEREGCTMPPLDRVYACPLEDERATECISQITQDSGAGFGVCGDKCEVIGNCIDNPELLEGDHNG